MNKHFVNSQTEVERFGAFVHAKQTKKWACISQMAAVINQRPGASTSSLGEDAKPGTRIENVLMIIF